MAARKQIKTAPRKKVIPAPAAAKVLPEPKGTVLNVQAVAGIRKLHDGRAIISVDGDTQTVPANKVSIRIEE